MAKKTSTPEIVGNFDALSNGQYASELTETTSSNASDDAGAAKELTGDEQADKILSAISSREKEVKTEVAEQEEAEEEVQEEQEEEVLEEEQEEDVKEPETEKEKVDPKADKTKPKKDKEIVDEEVDDNKELSFDIDDSTTAPSGESNGWKEVAKEALGIDLENDDFDSFKEKIQERTEYNLAKFKPETQRLIKFTESGGSINDFMEPVSKIDAAINLPMADLVDRHLFSSGWTDDTKRQAELERMVESGQADVIHKQAIDSLTNLRKETMDQIINERVKAQEKYEQRAANAPKEEAKAIRAKLETMKEFMGTKLSADNIEKIVKNYETGKYHDAMKNSEDIASFALWKEYGKMGEKNLMIKAQRELKEKHKDKFHKVPPKVGGTAGSTKATSSGQDPLGNWDDLEKGKV